MVELEGFGIVLHGVVDATDAAQELDRVDVTLAQHRLLDGQGRQLGVEGALVHAQALEGHADVLVRRGNLEVLVAQHGEPGVEGLFDLFDGILS